MKYLIYVVYVLASVPVFASGGGGPSWLPAGSTAWILLGDGTMTADSTTNRDIQMQARVTVKFGTDIHLVGPAFLAVSGYSGQMNGTMNYTDTDNGFSAQKASFKSTGEGAQVGLQIRLINAAYFHFLIEGGGFIEAWKLSFDYSGATVTGTSTADAAVNLSTSGGYGQVGIDLVLPNGYGLRVLGRASKGTTTKINGLQDGSKMNFVNGEAYVGVVKQY